MDQPSALYTKSKACTKCGIVKPQTEFGVRRDAKSGLQSNCKACQSAYHASPEGKARKAAYRAKPEVKERKNQLARERYKNPDVKKRKAEKARQLGQNPAFKVKQSVRHQKWRQNHPDKIRNNVRRQRHQRRAIGKIPKDWFAQQIMRQQGKCFYCKKLMEKPTIEHIRPVSKGGTNASSNLVLACAPCNYAKNNKLTMLL